ncbi:amino acid ABC transporter substrate-binding protein [Bacillus sp. FJAT-27245]|uniref:amino acid ABC transporter substrate-binding protein n=1 Tax=Bacillus sp. FJAT-27245 TaxID=1684144 RepID=UPI000A7CCC24|nr:amino acid ABC transporter substrate-binding protein [Bacillus sp. FJAT-27245]
MKKLSIVFAFMLSLVLVVTACGTNDANNAKNNNNNEGKKTGGNDVLAKVKDEGTLVVGTEGTYPPFTFHDDKGKLTGFDVEIAEEVGKRLGVEVKFLETQWDAIFAGLDAKRFDMIANQVGIRPDRQEKYLFSEPYITSAAVLIAREDNNKVKKFEDIKGLQSAQSMTSNYADIARKYGAKIVGVDGFNQAVELLNSKRVDVTINDKIAFLDFKKNRPEAKVKVVATESDVSKSGLMFRKDSQTLVDEVNKALKDMVDDGTYDNISKKWFGENVLK